MADSVAAMIEGVGHNVHTAYDGAAALALARQQRLDLIVADIGMPGMSGYEPAERVRRDPDLKHLQLAALTGYGRDEDHARVLSAGFNLHLTKPVTDSALHAALAELSAASLPRRRQRSSDRLHAMPSRPAISALQRSILDSGGVQAFRLR